MLALRIALRFAFYLVAYSLISVLLNVPIFPSLVEVGAEIPAMIKSGIVGDFAITYARWAQVFIVGVGSATFIGIIVSYYKSIARILVKDIDFWRSLPATALVSFFFAAFGDNPYTRIAPAFYITFFTTLFYIARSASLIDRRRQRHLRLLFADDKFIILQWYVLEMIPSIVLAARQSVSLSFLVLISTELIVGSSNNQGVGNRLVDWFFYSDFEKILITLIVLGASGYLANTAANAFSNRILLTRFQLSS